MPSRAWDRIKDLITAILLAVVGIGGFLFINPKGAAITVGPGGLTWRSLPFIYSSLLLMLTAIYAITSAIGLINALKETATANATPDPDANSPAAWLTNARRAGVVVCILAYAIALPLFGFILTTAPLLFVLFYVFGRTSFPSNFLASVVGGAALSILFVGFLKLPLTGSLWDPITPALNHAMRALGI